MNDVIFSKSFLFRTINFERTHYTDNSRGAPAHYFAYMLKGECKLVTDKETVFVREGDFFYIPMKCPYRSYWSGSPEISFVSLGFSFMPNRDGLLYPTQVIEKSDVEAEIFLRLSDSAMPTAADIGLFYTLAGMLIPKMRHDELTYTDEIILKSKGFFLSHPFSKVSELAKHCAVSESSLYAAFRKASSLTPNSLRNEILLEKAKEILLTTDKPIEYISDLLGFSSVSYFRKKFRGRYGMPPGRMRKNEDI